MMIPMFMRLKIRNEERRGVNLFIPLAILYLILLPFLLLALPFVLLWALFAKGASLQIIPALFMLLASLKGTEVEFCDSKSEVILKLL